MMGTGPSSRRVRCDWVFALILLGALALFPLRLPEIDRFTPGVRPEPMQTFRKPLVPKVLFIMVDALGANAAYKPGWMPRLQQRAQEGASGIGLASFPTITVSGIVSLMSGHRMHPGLQMVGTLEPPQEFDSVFARASAAGLKTVIVGEQDWERFFKHHGADLELVPFHGSPPMDYDEKVLLKVRQAMRTGNWNFLAVHLFDLDAVGHLSGLSNPLYQQKLLWLDQRIQELAALAGPQAAVVVSSDHGMTWAGSHGGAEPEARRIPWVMWGKRIRHAALGEFDQIDAAPTFCALLGLPPPALSGGRPLMAAVDASFREQAAVWADVLEQRNRRWFAARSDWPWLSENPDARLREAKALLTAGRCEDSRRLSEAAVRDMDKALGESAPTRWFGRLVLAFWLLALAACFALAWPQTSVWARNCSVALGLICLAALFLPLLAPDFWALCSVLGLACCGGLLGLSLLPGWHDRAMSWPQWSLWWLVLAGIALPQVVDISLWSYALIWSLCLSRLPWLRKSGAAGYMALCLGALSIYAVLACWIAGSEMSLLRVWLPAFDLRRRAAPPWRMIDAVLLAAAAAVCWQRFKALGAPGRRLAAWACALGPVAVSCVCSHWLWHPLACSWAAAGASLVAARLLAVSEEAFGLWMSLAVVSCCLPLLNATEQCFFSLQMLVGWSLAFLPRPAARLWRSLQILGLWLWAYATPGGGLDFSHISVQEIYMVMGKDWNVTVLTALLVVKHIGMLVAPILALLAASSASEVLAGFGLFAFWSGGSLFMLWFDLFYLGVPPSNLLNERPFEMSLWAALFAWMLPAAWGAARLWGLAARGRLGKAVREA